MSKSIKINKENGILTVSSREATKKIKKALIALGVTGIVTATAVTNHPAETRYSVEVDGEPFGVFDTEKETFVD